MAHAKGRNVRKDDMLTNTQGQVPIREFDEAAVTSELRQRVDSVNSAVKRPEEAQIVTQEALNPEFSI
jgi:hypothetical protein